MPRESSESDIVRWRACPCAECTGGTTLFDFLFERDEASGEISAGSEDERIEQIIRVEQESLREYVRICKHTIEQTSSLRKLDEGSEHLVYLGPGGEWIIKITRPGIYGDCYFLRDGRVYQRRQTPAEYLVRLHMVNSTFGFAWDAMAVTDAGQILSRQKFVEGDPPTQAEVDDFLHADGIEPVKQSCWLWRKVDPNKKMDYWIGDARADNFVKTANGIVPIDLRMWGVIVASDNDASSI